MRGMRLVVKSVLHAAKSKMLKLISIGSLTGLLLSSSASAVTIEYVAQEIGGGSWRYSYYLSNVTFNQYQGFQIYFDFNLYSNIDPFPAAPNADWAPISINPDTFLNIDGNYDAIALVNAPSLADPFVISFSWGGIGQPTAQNFSLYSCEDDFCSTGITFGQTGSTVARSTGGPNPNPDPNPVPEPLTSLLLALGLLGMSIIRWRG